MGHSSNIRSGRATRPDAEDLATGGSLPATGLLRLGLFAGTSSECDETSPSEDDAAQANPSCAPLAAAPPRRGRGRARFTPRPFRGRVVRAVVPTRDLRDVAWGATLRAHAQRRDPAVGRLERADLRVAQRVQRPGRLLLFVVDGSGSMGVRLTALARRAASRALQAAYVHRDRVGMIVFREARATLLFSPTTQATLVHRALDGLPLGGTTPLAAGLALARHTMARARQAGHLDSPVVILISDGRANVGSRPGHERVLAEVADAAAALARFPGLRTLFLDVTEAGKHTGPADRLSTMLHADRLRLARLDRAGLDAAEVLFRRLHPIAPQRIRP